MFGHVAGPAGLRHRCARPACDSFPLCRTSHSQPRQICGRTARCVHTHRRCGRALCGVRSSRRGIHTRNCQHAMALARVCSKGLRRPSACLWRELVVFLNINLRVSRNSESILVPWGSRITRHAESGKRVTRDNGLDAISGGLSSILPRGLQKAAGGHLSTWDAICRFVGCSSRYMDVPESS